MSIWSKYECKGQMTIFDFADIPETPSVAESSQSKINEIEEREILKGSGFENGKTRIYNFFKDDHTEKECVDFLKNEYGIGGWSIEEGMCDHSANGIDIKFDKLIGKCSEVHIGWPMVARRIKELIANGKYKPKEKPLCSKAEKCEAYPLGCGGTIEHCRFGGPFNWSNKTEEPKEDVHIDRAGREHKVPSWMKYERCENCIRWQKYDIKEQPPEGWGVMGYCVEHKFKCSTANYCNDFDDKNEVKNG